jgi:hypothetical protein
LINLALQFDLNDFERFLARIFRQVRKYILALAPDEHLGNRRQVAIWNAQRELRSVLDRWETAYRKENFYRGIRILLELQRDGSSTL